LIPRGTTKKGKYGRGKGSNGKKKAEGQKLLGRMHMENLKGGRGTWDVGDSHIKGHKANRGKTKQTRQTNLTVKRGG